MHFEKKKGLGCISWGLIIIFGFWLMGKIVSPTKTPQSTETAKSSRPSAGQDYLSAIKQMEADAAKPDDKRASRERLIDKLIGQGVFLKVERLTVFPRVFTGLAWNSLSIDDKQQFVSVVYALYIKQDPKATIVIIKDGRTGKQIGTFQAANPGLKLD